MNAALAQRKVDSFGYTILTEHSERDLVRREDGVCVPAGRVTEGVWLPDTETFSNPRRNLWWARSPQGRVVLICIDP